MAEKMVHKLLEGNWLFSVSTYDCIIIKRSVGYIYIKHSHMVQPPYLCFTSPSLSLSIQPVNLSGNDAAPCGPPQLKIDSTHTLTHTYTHTHTHKQTYQEILSSHFIYSSPPTHFSASDEYTHTLTVTYTHTLTHTHTQTHTHKHTRKSSAPPPIPCKTIHHIVTRQFLKSNYGKGSLRQTFQRIDQKDSSDSLAACQVLLK